MTEWNLDTPVVLFIFRRPELTERVFNCIAEAKPPELYIIADGPRKGSDEDVRVCNQTREVIDVDWDCDVQRNYADQNLGLKRRFSSGLNWVFNKTDNAIILEDDCLPSQDFFRFCEIMLRKYQDDQRVMNISGTNFLTEWKPDVQDYHFSVYGGIWGWATWKRAWTNYDPEIPEWERTEAKESVRGFIADDKQYHWRKKLFNEVRSGKIDTWDYQWSFYRLVNSGLSVVPSNNLVSNIGFGTHATHTTTDKGYSNLKRHEMDFPIRMREFVAPDRDYDRQLYHLLSGGNSWYRRVFRHLQYYYDRLIRS